MVSQNEKVTSRQKRWLDKSPYWIGPEGVKKVEDLRNAKFMGHWCIKTKFGWSERPVDVFYQEKPDFEKGHKHYFGLYKQGGMLMICDASSAFSEPMTGVLTKDGEVLVSRYRHDCQMKKGAMVDGGRDYFRTSLPVSLVTVTVKGSDFKFRRQVPV